MTRKELEKIAVILDKIKDPDPFVFECIDIVKRNIEVFEQRKGQLKEQYEYDRGPW